MPSQTWCAVLLLAVVLAACRNEPAVPPRAEAPTRADTVADAPKEPVATGSIVLREAEYKTVKHPTKKYYAKTWPDGLGVSFKNSYGNFADYTFPTEGFVLNEETYLLSRGSPDLLPMRVVRIAENDYRIEWLPSSPARGTNMKVVQSH